MAIPTPIRYDPCGKTCDQVIAHRNVDCVYYNGCLDRILKYRWKGFSCTECKMLEREDLFTDSINKTHPDHEADNVYLQF